MKLFILNDSNAKHTAWGNRLTYKRGELMFDFLTEHQLKLLNDPDKGATFTKQVIEQNSTEESTRMSYIDLSIVNERVNAENIRCCLKGKIL